MQQFEIMKKDSKIDSYIVLDRGHNFQDYYLIAHKRTGKMKHISANQLKTEWKFIKLV